MAVRDVRESSRFKWIADLDDERYVAMLSVPIVSEDRVVGVMNVQAIAPHVFTQEETDFVLAIAAQVAGIIELSSLRQRLTHQLEIEREVVMRLSVLNSAKSDLLAMLSHDFRGPLTSVRAYIHGLRPKLAPTEAEVCDHIETEVDALESMVTNLMLSLELESQQTPLLHLETFDLVATAREVTRRFRAAAPRHTLSVSATTSICRVRADQTRVRSVLINLVGNAIKYSPNGGSVWVRVEPNERVVEVSVQDEGIGIDIRDAATIFERYGRGDAALERGIRGHGLGLFICKQVVESHRGEIFARSLPNGSCFVFTLPMQADES
jgi:signal transduction histidine kinase